ncbi:MAG: 2-oxoacid:acceptor oxidoreductase family protein [Pyrodictiaceae archaeon]
MSQTGRLEIIIAGRGGQGILLAGYLLGKALVSRGYYVVNSETYSAETRGGFSRSDLIVFRSEEDLDLIKVRKADIAIFMYKEQMYSYSDLVSPNPKLVLIDSTFTDKPVKPWPNTFMVPFTRLAEEATGTYRVANIYMLGVFSYMTGMIDLDTLKETIKTTVNPRWRDLNLKAAEAGYKYASEHLGKVELSF